jgi:hypothetical protein
MNWREHIATSLSMGPDDFDYAPLLVRHSFSEGGNQRGGLGNLSAVALAKLLDELNEVLAA